jgi:cell division protein FtsB
MSNNRQAYPQTNRKGNGVNGARLRRKRYIPSLSLRLAIIAIIFAVTSTVCYTALSNISRPYVLGAQQTSVIAERTQALKQLDAENNKLSQQCAFLSRPDGVEYEARLKGYLMPGERSLVLTPTFHTTNH